MIRRIRPGRLYHADCFVCAQCKRTLQDDDVSALIKVDESSSSSWNELESICQTCSNPTGSTNKTAEEKPAQPTVNGDTPAKVNGSADVQDKPHSSESTPMNHDSAPDTSAPQVTNDHPTTVTTPTPDEHSMEVDEVSNHKSSVKEHSSSSNSSATAPPIATVTPTKLTGRQSKARQSTSSNGSKRSPAKAKASTPASSRQKQAATTERKGRSPATRSKASVNSASTPPASSAVRTRSSNRRSTKTSRYRKRHFSSGSDEDESDDDDDDDDEADSDFSEEEPQDDVKEETHPPPVKSKSTANDKDRKAEPEATTSLLSEPLSLLSGLASNPMSISSIMKPDAPPSFMPPNFNPAFPTPAQFLPPNHAFPPGFAMPPRLPMPAPAPSGHPPAPIPDANRSSHSTNGSDNDSPDPASSPSKMDISTNAEPGTPARPPSPSKVVRPPHPPTGTQKPSALSSLLEFGTIPPSNIGDMRPNNVPSHAFPFPFVNPGPGVPFSPQAAAGMATFYRPPFGVPPTAMPLDMSQGPSKKPPVAVDEDEMLDDSPAGSKKKGRKSNPRAKGKTKKNGVDAENGIDEDNPSPPPPAKKKKKSKQDATDDGGEEPKTTNGNSHNLLAQMGLMNNAFMPPPGSTNGTAPPSAAQQAQLAAMYNMAPHFAAYNPFPGAFNPAFAAAAFGGGYPSPYGFHPAFGAAPPGQPFPFMPPNSSASPMNK